MPKWVDQQNAVLADTVYCDNVLAAKNVTVNLPEITFATSEINTMGTTELPLVGLVEAMEATLSKIGADSQLIAMSTPQKHNYECRFVQNSIGADGTATAKGCKAFITGIPKSVPGIAVEVGSATEGEIPIAVTRYQLYVDGEEMLCVDKLNSICRIKGKDYYAEIMAYL